MKKNTKIVLSVLGGVVVVAIVVIVGIKILNRPAIEFKNSAEKVEIKGNYNAVDYIKDVHGHDIADIEIDDSAVNIEKLGTYVIKYKINDKEYELQLEVVDTQAPTFDIENLDIDLGMNVKAEDLVKNIKDQTNTTVRFKEDYSFEKAARQMLRLLLRMKLVIRQKKKPLLKLIKEKRNQY